jgi:hypothetical protein
LHSLLKAALCFAATASLAVAGNFSFTGAFTGENDIQLFTFTTAAGGTTVKTLSYGGGVNAAGATILAGGFDPLITIFDSIGNEVGSFDNSGNGGGGCLGGITAGTNGCLDSYFNTAIGAGTYTVALTQFSNVYSSPGITFTPGNLCSASFCDAFDNTTALTGNWAVDIVAADSAAIAGNTPEPATLLMAGLGLAGICYRSRKSS